jgi:4-amino-4-deoxy-L-arabinose transferase-like glycosyltransferase
MALGIFGLTVGVRLFHLRSAYDVFLDESTYSRIAAGAAVDGRLVFGNFPFYLHGPLSFYLQALWIHVFGTTGTAIEVIHGLRVLNVLVAGLIAVLLFSVVRSVTSRVYGLIAAALFAFDPFIISFDSRLFLETLATLWVALGFYLLLPLAGEDPDRSRQRRRALAAGFAFGLALLTKETSAPLYVLPLLWCAVRARPLPRFAAVTALVTAAVTYLPYPLTVIATGAGAQFSEQKFGGVERMLGLVKETGFSRPGAPSLLSRISAELSTFLMTYVLIGLGVIAAVWLYRRGTGRQRLVATWGLAALCMLAFQITQGTIEEQMFYYLVVPSVVTVACALSFVSTGRPASPRRVAAALAVAVAVAGFDVATWVNAHTRNDTAIVRAVAWMQSNAPRDTRVAPLADGIQLLLPDYVLLFNPEAGDVSPAQLQAAGTQLVVTSSLQAEQGYSAASPSLLRWLELHARRRFAASGASAGTVVIWQLGSSLPRSAPPGPEPLEPRAPLSVGAPTYHG